MGRVRQPHTRNTSSAATSLRTLKLLPLRGCCSLLRARGVTSIGSDRLREFGRGSKPDPSQACGHCGHHRAAVLPDGTVTPCPLTRWMHAGNVTTAPLADILASVTQMAATLPARERKCTPDLGCRPAASAAQSLSTKAPCNPNCLPDSYCPPTCLPGACKPRI